MNWWTFQWTPTFNRTFILICLYALLIDLMLLVNGQSMFSWTPIIKEGKKSIISGSEKHLKPAKSFFATHDNVYRSHLHSTHNKELVPLEKKDDPYRLMLNAKKYKPAPNEVHVNIQRNSIENRISETPRTGSREIKFIPRHSNEQKTTQNNFRNVVTKVSNTKQVANEKTSRNNLNYDNADGGISRSDNVEYLSWKTIDAQSKSKTRLPFNPSRKDPSRKRIKKNVKSKQENKNKINALLEEVDDNENTKTLNTFSAKLFAGDKGDINQTHASNIPRFLGMVMVNSEIERSTKDNQTETKETSDGINKK